MTRSRASPPRNDGAAPLRYSSCDHAPPIALAGRLLEIIQVIVIPPDAPVVKRQATKVYDGEVVANATTVKQSVAVSPRGRGLIAVPPRHHRSNIAG